MSKCPKCGAPMEGSVCDYCGYTQQKTTQVASNGTGNPAAVLNHFVANQQSIATKATVSTKSRWLALAICYFLGFFGGHYFYVGKTGKGILYLCTVGLFGIGWMVDLVRIAIGSFTDAQNLPLKK